MVSVQMQQEFLPTDISLTLSYALYVPACMLALAAVMMVLSLLMIDPSKAVKMQMYKMIAAFGLVAIVLIALGISQKAPLIANVPADNKANLIKNIETVYDDMDWIRIDDEDSASAESVEVVVSQDGVVKSGFVVQDLETFEPTLHLIPTEEVAKDVTKLKK